MWSHRDTPYLAIWVVYSANFRVNWPRDNALCIDRVKSIPWHLYEYKLHINVTESAVIQCASMSRSPYKITNGSAIFVNTTFDKTHASTIILQGGVIGILWNHIAWISIEIFGKHMHKVILAQCAYFMGKQYALTLIGSDNGLAPDRRQAIIWNNAGMLLIGPLGTNFSEILIEILTFSFKKMRLKVSSAKRRPFCLGLNVLKWDIETPLRRRRLCYCQSKGDLFMILGVDLLPTMVIQCNKET